MAGREIAARVISHLSQLIRLPEQPNGVPWPTEEWPVAEPPTAAHQGLQAILDQVFAEPQPETTVQTNAVLVVHRGAIVAERYAPGIGPDDTQASWSTAKSMLHAVVGILVRDGRLDIHAPAAVAAWQEPGDPRAAITLDSLLHMTPGLRFAEDYVDAGVSDVIKMLFQPGADDTGAFAAAFPLDHAPDTDFNYSSGTSNIISSVVRDVVGGQAAYEALMRSELFEPIGMRSAQPRFDKSGSWIGSTFCFATPRDFARFALLYLRDGVWGGRRILPEGWVDYGRTPGPVAVSQAQGSGFGYGAHWWLANDDLGTFLARGYNSQYFYLAPALDLIVVRLGVTPVDRAPHIWAMMRSIIDLFR
jgi:CubicO group peptidase (beta-lactamase class C family)